MVYKIEKNVPPPKVISNDLPFEIMEIGDSFSVPLNGLNVQNVRGRIIYASRSSSPKNLSPDFPDKNRKFDVGELNKSKFWGENEC